MASKQRRGKRASPSAEPTLVASRPYSPGAEYGMPKSKRGLLPWQHVSERMAAARYYWISTVDPDGRPHATPVDGLWLDDLLYFGGSPTTRRNRNLALNPATCVHLESGIDVVILHGDAHPLRALRAHACRAALRSDGPKIRLQREAGGLRSPSRRYVPCSAHASSLPGRNR